MDGISSRPLLKKTVLKNKKSSASVKKNTQGEMSKYNYRHGFNSGSRGNRLEHTGLDNGEGMERGSPWRYYGGGGGGVLNVKECQEAAGGR